MIARLILVQLGPGRRDDYAKVSIQLKPLLSGAPGFAGAFGLIDDEKGEYGVFQLWNSQEEADAANVTYGPLARAAWAQLPGAGTPQIREFEIPDRSK